MTNTTHTYMTPLILKRLLHVDSCDLRHHANSDLREDRRYGTEDSYLSLVYTEGYELNLYRDGKIVISPDTKWARQEQAS